VVDPPKPFLTSTDVYTGVEIAKTWQFKFDKAQTELLKGYATQPRNLISDRFVCVESTETVVPNVTVYQASPHPPTLPSSWTVLY